MLVSLISCQCGHRDANDNTVCDKCGATYTDGKDIYDNNEQGLSFFLKDDGTYSVGVGSATKLSDIYIPAMYNGKPITEIEEGGFANCANLKNISIPDSVSNVDLSMFDGCHEDLIQIENGLMYLDKWVVGSTENLSNIVFRDNTVGIKAGISLTMSQYKHEATELFIPKNVRYIETLALVCSLNLVDYIVDIENPYFTSINGIIYTKDAKKLIQHPIAKESKSLVIPSSVEIISTCAFLGCEGIESINFEENSSLNKIETLAFYCLDSSFTITLPEGITHIEKEAFRECGLTSITLPYSITTIDNLAFASCIYLKEITLSQKITFIGEDAFSWCYSLSDIYFDGTIYEWEAINKVERWNYCVKSFTVHCSDGNLNLEGWDYPEDYH